jgi:hypothetical protein
VWPALAADECQNRQISFTHLLTGPGRAVQLSPLSRIDRGVEWISLAEHSLKSEQLGTPRGCGRRLGMITTCRAAGENCSGVGIHSLASVGHPCDAKFNSLNFPVHGLPGREAEVFENHRRVSRPPAPGSPGETIGGWRFRSRPPRYRSYASVNGAPLWHVTEYSIEEFDPGSD